METIADALPDLDFFAGLDPTTSALLAGCARAEAFRAGDYLFREGEPADRFRVLRRGRVAIEIRRPAGGSVVLDTVDPGDVVGWSWIVPPYRWAFDARALQDTGTVAFDAGCLRAKAEADPRVGYDLLRRVVPVLNRRLQSARFRLLDLYGSSA